MEIQNLIKKHKLEHFAEDIIEAVSFVERGNSVVFAGLPKIGINTILEFLNAFFLSKKEYSILYDPEDIYQVEDIKKFIISHTDKKIIIILPRLSSKKLNYFSEFDDLMLEVKKYKPIILSHGSLEIVQNPYKYFKKSIDAIAYTKFVRTLDLKNTELNIARIEEEYGLEIPKKIQKSIYQLSGGHTGLIKRLCQYYSISKTLFTSQILTNTAIIFSISQILEFTRDINKDILFQTGLINEKNEFVSKLISMYTQKDTLSLINLSGNSKKIFDLMHSNKNSIITLEEIQKVLDQNGENSLWAIYKSLARLKSEIKDHYRLITLKGRGYILKDK